jgi:4-hydroxy-3-methylbut-2-enyl diphosphate reductase
MIEILEEKNSASQFFQKGLGLKKEVADILRRDYHSRLVEEIRARDYSLHVDDLTIYLAREFGFCYGVDRAVDYAYQTREKFPDRRIFLTGEIIHNPHVNRRLIEMGIQFLSGQYSDGVTFDDLQPEDVVILPAFGVSVGQFRELQKLGCILVDTTCGSVLNVWKRVEFYAKNGYTSIIHGKYFHEESIATSSQALKYPGGKYLIVRNMGEALIVCDYILNRGDKEKLMDQFAKAASPNFDPDRDLDKIGVANQTTMLSSESLAIADEFQKVMLKKFGAENLDAHFQNFDTICSATQERQDAVLEMVRKNKLDVMLVIGGYNSSNTNHLAVMASQHCPTFHIDDPSCMISADKIRHKQIGAAEIITTSNWLRDGSLKIGMTAGASTPNNKIGEALERLLTLRGVDVEAIFN